MTEFIYTINIPNISEYSLKCAQKLDAVVGELSWIERHHIMISPISELNRIKRLVDYAQLLHQNLIRAHVSEKSNNHPMWVSLDTLTRKEISDKLQWMKERLVLGREE